MAGTRVFAGQWDPDEWCEWAHVNEVYADYGDAWRRLYGLLRTFLDDDCPHCRNAGIEALGELSTATRGAAFVTEVDGEDYVLYPADVPITVRY